MCYSFFPCRGLLDGVWWFETYVSGLPIGSILTLQYDPWRRAWYVVPKRRFQTTSRRVITQKTEEFTSTEAEAYDLADIIHFCPQLPLDSFFTLTLLSKKRLRRTKEMYVDFREVF